MSAERAGIHDMVMGMPDGYDTMLGRKFGEYEPSGGQWQKIIIARAMARDALVTVLDEPTASLDARLGIRGFHANQRALGRPHRHHHFTQVFNHRHG